MKKEKVRFEIIDLLKIVCCLAILLYHLGFLSGGYLAVCTFFVISGYLSYVSLSGKERISFSDYYLRLFRRIYLPLIVVIFTTIAVLSFIPDIHWIHLKTETTSILLGYNNFWQLNANLDYFAKSIDSPFMHLWYIAILLQFDLVFPFLYLLLKKIEDKIAKKAPIYLSFLLTAIFFFYFYYMSLTQEIMVVYYHTLTRIFSLLLGVSWGVLTSYYPVLLPEFLRKKKCAWILFSGYFLALLAFFFLVDAKSSWMPISMLLVSIMTCRLIDYGKIVLQDMATFGRRVLAYLANRSYEIYLVQYPILFLFQYYNLPLDSYFLLLLLSILVTSCVIYSGLEKKRGEDHFSRLKMTIFLFLILIGSYGCYQYVTAKDYRAQMKQLEEQLAENEKFVEEKQKEYAQQLEQEKEEWNALLADIDSGEKELATVVQNLSVVGVGDSVMLGAVNDLYEQFPKGYFDAKVSRTPWVVNSILVDLKKKDLLGNPIILNLGANGDCSAACKKEIIRTCEDRDIFWVNVTNDKDVHVNAKLEALSKEYSNVHVVDWETISKGHTEYFYADGIHLKPTGRKVYTKAIYDKIYEVYLERYHQEQEGILNDYREKQKDKITFYGNDILLNAFQELEKNFPEANFHVQKEYDFNQVKRELEEALEKDTITNTVVLAFSKTTPMGEEEYQILLELCKKEHVYLLLTERPEFSLEEENLTVIPFYEELENHEEYLMVDQIHLTKEGNLALVEQLNAILMSSS